MTARRADGGRVRFICGDALTVLRTLEAGSVQCCVTSPPYWRQRSYGHAEQLGLEQTPQEYVAALVAVFAEARRVLRPDGSLWLNLGEKWAAGGNGDGGSCMASRRDVAWAHARDARGWRSPPAGYKDKDITGAPWLVALALQRDGWWLRHVVIWDKMVAPEPPRLDRPSNSHEYLFLLTPQADSCVRNPGEPWFLSSVWSVRPQPRVEDHPAMMAPEIARRCIVCSSQEGDTILDPFSGAGTTALVADRLGRSAIGIELNRSYVALAKARLERDAGMFASVEDATPPALAPQTPDLFAEAAA